MNSMEPIKRSKLRIILGRSYYTTLRYFDWYFSKKKFSSKKKSMLLPHLAFTHKTPLYRKLKQVDMWMQYNKVINLGIAIKRLDKIIINPGETFSYWRLIGKPTRKKGYADGMILYCGKFYEGVGGGLCQLSNLIYWMTLHTPLRITERYRHSYDVFPDVKRTQPFGSGATCVYNYRDLQIYNGTNQAYQLHLYMTDEYLVGEWRRMYPRALKYEIYEKKHWITHEYWGGYIRHNILYRKIYNFNDELIDDEYITENHAIMMYQPFLGDTHVTKVV